MNFSNKNKTNKKKYREKKTQGIYLNNDNGIILFFSCLTLPSLMFLHKYKTGNNAYSNHTLAYKLEGKTFVFLYIQNASIGTTLV